MAEARVGDGLFADFGSALHNLKFDTSTEPWSFDRTGWATARMCRACGRKKKLSIVLATAPKFVPRARVISVGRRARAHRPRRESDAFLVASNIPTRESSAAVLPPPETADIAIIGAGMTGRARRFANWLHTLVDAPQQVVVLDARGVAGGATGRNGGHLWCNPSSDFERESTAELLKFLEEREVDCDLQQHGAAALERKEAETGVEYSDTAADPEAAAVDEEGPSQRRGTRRRLRRSCRRRPLCTRASIQRR